MIAVLRTAFFGAFLRRLMEAASVLSVYAFLARAAPQDNPQKYGWAGPWAVCRLLSTQRKSLSGGASPERLWGISERASVRLVFLFLGGFLLGCHEVFPPFERFVLPRFSTGHLDAQATQLLV